MAKLHWEDFQAGAVAIYGPRLVTREEILAFAAEFDPQPMHLDEAAASATMLGGLGASGWHSCCLLMRMIADGFLLNSTSMGAPGVEDVRCGPVRVFAFARRSWKRANPNRARKWAWRNICSR
jgi:acyl dehydratase